MNAFEQNWYDRFMKNMVTVATLNKLVAAGKLQQLTVDLWIQERLEKFGY